MASRAADSDDGYVVIPGAEKLAPFNPSSKDVIAAALRFAALGPGDKIYDLGCGDGRVLVALVGGANARGMHDVKGVGVEYDEKFWEKATSLVKEKGLEDQIEIRHADACRVPLDDADAVFCYLSNRENEEIKRNLCAAHARGARIISNMFKLKFLGEPTESVVCDGITRLYLYGGKDATNDAAFESMLAAFLDPSSNPALLKIFNLAMVLLIITLAGLAFFVDNPRLSFHFTIMMILACCLFALIQWWMSLPENTSEKKSKEE